MQETWVDIKEYPNYAVSDHGRIMNVQRETFLTPRENSKGYFRVTLSDGGHVEEYYIHKLVAHTFFGWPYNDTTIHYDGDRSNNHVSNLRLRKRERQEVNTRPLESHEVSEYRRQWGKRIRIIETGEIFRTVRDCARYVNGDYSSIYRCLRDERGSHRGFTYEYYDG